MGDVEPNPTLPPLSTLNLSPPDAAETIKSLLSRGTQMLRNKMQPNQSSRVIDTQHATSPASKQQPNV